MNSVDCIITAIVAVVLFLIVACLGRKLMPIVDHTLILASIDNQKQD